MLLEIAADGTQLPLSLEITDNFASMGLNKKKILG